MGTQDVRIIQVYIKQIEAMAKWVNVRGLSKELGVPSTTLWRFINNINKTTKVDLSMIARMEELGILNAPIIIK